jgi:hypothetical protein
MKVIKFLLLMNLPITIGAGIATYYSMQTKKCEEAIRVAYQLGQEDLILEVIE